MKWYGEIGFREEYMESPGISTFRIISRNFYGDLLRSSWHEQQGEKINPDLQVSNRLSVVADPFLQNNFYKIAYVTYGGAKWTVSSVEQDPDRPRLTLSLGSLYLEEEEDEE